MFSDKYESYVINLRREFHRYPELGGQEKRTSERIIKEIESMNIPYERVKDYGVIATLKGEKPGKTLMLRADIDALPVHEDKFNLVKEKAVVSEIDGISHVCGHDAHAAVLLGTMKSLIEIKNQIKGTVLFCFEQGEENATGIEPMFEALKNKNVDAAWGFHFHVFPGGTISVEPGPRMAGACMFDIDIIGRGGHGASPDLAIDPIQCSINVLTGIQSIVTREMDPKEMKVLHIGKIHAGETGNVFPEKATIEGGFRCYNMSLMEQFKEDISRIVNNTAAAHRCKAKINFRKTLNAVVNDEKLSALAAEAVSKAIGSDKLVSVKSLNGSETFGRYLDLCPGIYAFIGLENKELGSGEYNHNPKFDIDESYMKDGMAITVQFAIDFLDSKLQ